MGYTIDKPVFPAKFVERVNRFVVIVNYNDKKLKCHLPNPGRMKELFAKNKTVYITLSDNNNRKTKATVVAIKHNDEIIQLDSNLVSEFLTQEFKNGLIKNYSFIRREAKFGRHRFDFVLEHNNEIVIVETKSTTRVINNVACFPDAISIRAIKHVNKLIELSRTYSVMLIFMVYRRANAFTTCFDIDPKFSEVFQKFLKYGTVLVFLVQSNLIKKNGQQFIHVNIKEKIPLVDSETVFL